MKFLKELATYHNELMNAVSEYDQSLVHDLECLLTWLDPNDNHNNHHMNEPSHEIKNCIKSLELDREDHSGLLQLIRQWMIPRIRYNFFHTLQKLQYYNEMVELEEYYRFPFKYVNILSVSEIDKEIFGLRKYLINTSTIFRASIEEQIRSLILYEDDFCMALKLYKWMVQGIGHPLIKFLIDILTKKVELFSKSRMVGKIDHGNVILETFSSFVEKWWENFVQLLQFPKRNDEELNSLLYCCFQKDFIKIKMDELFNEIIPKFPASKPALLEMKSVLKEDTYELDKLVARICKDFDLKLFIPSVTTIEILLYYVKAIKCIMVIDLTGRSLSRFSHKLKPKIKERSDLIITVLCAILELNSDEIHEVVCKNTLTENPHLLKQLAIEFKESVTLSFHSVSTIKSKAAVYSVAKERQDSVVKQFLEWVPEPSTFKEDAAQSPSPDDDSIELPELPKDVLEVVFQVFDSPEVLINEFIKLITNHMLQMDGYALSSKWTQLLRILMNKYFRNNKQVLKSICEESNLINVFVMWSDLEKSATFQTWGTKLQLIPTNVYPKIISYLYWKINRKSQYGDYKVPPVLAAAFIRMERAFGMKSPGRKLRFLKDQGTADITIIFDDSRSWSGKVSIPKYTIVELFQRTQLELTARDVTQSTNIPKARVEEILLFWSQEHVLYKRDEGIYAILEHFS